MEKTMEHEMESKVIHSERLLNPPICARCDRMLHVDLICRREHAGLLRLGSQSTGGPPELSSLPEPTIWKPCCPFA